ncbi:site-specific integrase [Aliarcobacter butzleri]|uniref:site-specific integrase n=1 Tax=Aliarcobacter butzleri TaxID=28197 RepID=UPI0021B2D2AB|nr:site-specific integrase [Aliarcobacter butzleri]MCT7603815.1 site-specific integrase [Aliarcobacter butzleri]
MAIKKSEYINKVDTGLKADKTHTYFYFRIKSNDKEYVKLFDFADKNWDVKTKKEKAKTFALSYKDSILNPKTELDTNIKLDTFAEMHFDKLENTTWTTTKKKHYYNYISKALGNKKVVDIKQMHIKEVIKQQEALNLAPRTIKTTLEILNPIFKEAIANRLIDFNPCIGISIKLKKTKKLVLDATNQLEEILKAIYYIFGNNPFYLSFYLFAMQGRRKSEILKLKWENIDFNNNKFLILDTKNGEHQMFALPFNIKDELLKFKNDYGYVYESSIKDTHIANVEKQTNKIKKIIPSFTLHYMRNVVVSAMAEQGISATLMSSALGHNNTNTLSKYLTMSYMEGSKEANNLIKQITNKATS